MTRGATSAVFLRCHPSLCGNSTPGCGGLDQSSGHGTAEVGLGLEVSQSLLHAVYAGGKLTRRPSSTDGNDKKRRVADGADGPFACNGRGSRFRLQGTRVLAFWRIGIRGASAGQRQPDGPLVCLDTEKGRGDALERYDRRQPYAPPRRRSASGHHLWRLVLEVPRDHDRQLLRIEVLPDRRVDFTQRECHDVRLVLRVVLHASAC